MVELSGEDPSLDAAVSRILARGPEALGDGPAREDKRENRLDREPHEMDEGVEIDEGPADVAASKDAKAEPEDAEEESFLELPGEEGAEPEKIPLTQAAEIVKQHRQMQGDIASAVIKAESEAQAKADAAIAEVTKMHSYVRQQAEMALRAIPAPQRPDPSLRQTDPETYYALMDQYEAGAAAYQQVYDLMEAAKAREDEGVKAQRQLHDQREHDRLARRQGWQEWNKPEWRAQKQQFLQKGLEKHFGVTADDFARIAEQVSDHRLMVIVNEVLEAREAKTKAPEIKKAV
ncbi:MAG: hypothetical protein RLZZ182_186, partial [Pseudomonadota bacterium]